jgi:hypothetical protein
MKKTLAALAVIALFGLSMPTLASADIFTFSCDPSTEPAPADWFGGPWSAPVRVVVNTQARTVELFDKDLKTLFDTARPARLASLNNYQLDLTVTDNVITWGIVEMWGFSGYIDRRTGQLDVIWTNRGGYSPDTLNRQFHGTCKQQR